MKPQTFLRRCLAPVAFIGIALMMTVALLRSAPWPLTLLRMLPVYASLVVVWIIFQQCKRKLEEAAKLTLDEKASLLPVRQSINGYAIMNLLAIAVAFMAGWSIGHSVLK